MNLQSNARKVRRGETGFELFKQRAREMLELYKIYSARLVKLINRDEIQEYHYLVESFFMVWDKGIFLQYKFEHARTQFHLEEVLASTKDCIDDLFAIDCFIFRCFAAGLISF